MDSCIIYVVWLVDLAHSILPYIRVITLYTESCNHIYINSYTVYTLHIEFRTSHHRSSAEHKESGTADTQNPTFVNHLANPRGEEEDEMAPPPLPPRNSMVAEEFTMLQCSAYEPTQAMPGDNYQIAGPGNMKLWSLQSLLKHEQQIRILLSIAN